MRWRKRENEAEGDPNGEPSTEATTDVGSSAEPDAVDPDVTEAAAPSTAQPPPVPHSDVDWQPAAEAPSTVSLGDGRDEAFDSAASEPRELPELPDVRIDEIELRRATRRAVARALAEDLGDRGDVTSMTTIPPGAMGTAQVVARDEGVVYGIEVARQAFAQVDTRVDFTPRLEDGDHVHRGDVIADVSGPLRSILTAERVALNFLGELSGIATHTRRFVDAVAGLPVAVRDTRKTTPGLRLLEKAAVVAGGGANHRLGLHDQILIKDNHIAAAGGIRAAVEMAIRRSRGVHIQVEVADLGQLEDALQAGATDIMLDNFDPADVRTAIQRIGGRARVEVSGNLDLTTVRTYAQAGADRLAIGALTHSAPWLDIALDLDAEAVASDPSTIAARDIWHVEGERETNVVIAAGAATSAFGTAPPATETAPAEAVEEPQDEVEPEESGETDGPDEGAAPHDGQDLAARAAAMVKAPLDEDLSGAAEDIDLEAPAPPEEASSEPSHGTDPDGDGRAEETVGEEPAPSGGEDGDEPPTASDPDGAEEGEEPLVSDPDASEGGDELPDASEDGDETPVVADVEVVEPDPATDLDVDLYDDDEGQGEGEDGDEGESTVEAAAGEPATVPSGAVDGDPDDTEGLFAWREQRFRHTPSDG